MNPTKEKIQTDNSLNRVPEQVSAQNAGEAVLPEVQPLRPYVPDKKKQRPSLRDNARILVIGGGIALVLLLFAIQSAFHTAVPAKNTGMSKQQASKAADIAASDQPSLIPLMDTGRRPDETPNKNTVLPEEIGRTASKQPKASPAKNLGHVPPFETTDLWQPPPYQPAPPQPAPVSTQAPATQNSLNTAKAEREALEKSSLVFVRNATSTQAPAAHEVGQAVEIAVGLPPGTRLRAKLESAASTAVQTPVVAVIEYNYEKDGEIVVPAGAKAFGQLQNADRSGYIGVHFNSLLFPDGSSIGMEAAATDLDLRPLKGKVEGKGTGKNILVRSLSGLGQVAATLVGRNSLNQPLSEGDVLRDKLSNNVAEASDQRLSQLAITEHLVVSVPASTEIYLVLQKPAKMKVDNVSAHSVAPGPTSSQTGVDELQRLLQLQRELVTK